jgi:acyl-CoA synthetase (AMP-forming)/AMP-acid ligase II
MSVLNSVPGLLRVQASRIPDEPFVRWRGRSVSYGEFDARTDALAAGLADVGVRPGDVVSVMLPKGGGGVRSDQPGVDRAGGRVRHR